MFPGLLISKVNFLPACCTLFINNYSDMNTLSFSSPLLLISLIFFSEIKLPENGNERVVQKMKRKNNVPVGDCRIVIDKSDYLMRLYDEQGLFARYPVVFGAAPGEDKWKEGDRRTPEGSFKIRSIRKHKKWDRFILLDYPNQKSIEKFERRKKEHKLSETDKMGGSIGIHGTWPHDAYLIDNYKNWTEGCVSLKNQDVQDLLQYIKPGTEVIIQK